MEGGRQPGSRGSDDPGGSLGRRDLGGRPLRQWHHLERPVRGPEDEEHARAGHDPQALRGPQDGGASTDQSAARRDATDGHGLVRDGGRLFPAGCALPGRAGGPHRGASQRASRDRRAARGAAARPPRRRHGPRSLALPERDHDGHPAREKIRVHRPPRARACGRGIPADPSPRRDAHHPRHRPDDDRSVLQRCGADEPARGAPGIGDHRQHPDRHVYPTVQGLPGVRRVPGATWPDRSASARGHDDQRSQGDDARGPHRQHRSGQGRRPRAAGRALPGSDRGPRRAGVHRWPAGIRTGCDSSEGQSARRRAVRSSP